MLRRPSVVALIAPLLLGLSGCGGPGSTALGSPTPGATAGASSSAAASATVRVFTMDDDPLIDCGLRDGAAVVRAKCGKLDVPEDRSATGGRTIALDVAVLPATSREPAPDPLFILAGGPGGAATDMAWVAARFAGVHATRDIVLVDQRGTGDSSEKRFGQPPDVTGLSATQAAAKMQAWITSELARFGVDPRMYTTAPAMDDIDAVRMALGYDRINLYGGSYGATAAQYYVRQHGDHVRSVILDGATLIDVPVLELIAPSSQRALDLLFDRCAADAACASTYPTLRADFAAATAHLAKGSETTDVVSRFSGEPIVVDALLFAATVHGGLVSSDLTAQLPLLIHAAAAGRWRDVATAIADTEPAPVGLQLMSGMIRCSEAWAVFDPAKVAQLGAGSYLLDFEVATARQQAVSCAAAPKGVVPANDATRATTAVPVLLVVGNADPQDPPSNIATASTDFPNSLTVVVPAQGHTVAHLGCMPTIVDAFIAAGTVTGLDTSCVATGVTPPPFRLP